MDNLVFEESINTELSSSEFVDKQWLYVNDNNNASYSGQVVIDTTSLSNCGSYINWSESFFSMPLVLQWEAADLGAVGLFNATLPLDFFAGLKNGYWQLLHSLTCEFNNGNIIQQTPFLNIFTTFKNLTSWSENDVKCWGSITGFSPDTCDSWLYNPVQTTAGNTGLLATSGTGICNNRNAQYIGIQALTAGWVAVADPPLPLAVSGTNTACYNSATIASSVSDNIRRIYNKGFAQRQSWINYSSSTNDGSSITNLSANQASLMSGIAGGATNISGYGQIFQAYVQRAVGTRAIIWDAVIRLKDVADFFQKCPLLKGSTMRIYLNTNQTYFTMELTGGTTSDAVASAANTAVYGNQIKAGSMSLTSSPVILGGGGTNPVMIASNDVGQGAYPLTPLQGASVAAGAGIVANVKVGLSIVKTQFSQFTNQYQAPITSCRLYAPAYTMSPIAEQRYLSLSPTKKIVYNDIFYYSYTNVPPGTFSFLVSNGIPNVRGVLVFPMLTKTANGVATDPAFVAGATTSAPLLSPFSTTGATPDPISLTTFNIQVSGKNLFINNMLYNFEVFYEQLVSSNQLNGSLTTSLSSGLIGYEEFQSLYRYYYGNVSRSIPSEDGVAKAIQIVGTNNSTQAVDFIVYVEFERTLTIDIRTGARIA